VSATTLTCANCAEPFPTPTARRGARPQRFCTPKCQIKAANERRSIKRRGNLSTAGETPGQPSSPEVITIPPSDSRALSDSPSTPSDSLAALLDKAHSRVGVTSFEIALIAKMRGISAWAPVRVIIGR
jgi:hypothetical protein